MSNYSQFKATLSIVKASLRSMLRNPSSLIFSILFPVIFIVIFGVLGQNSTELKVYIDPLTSKENPVFQAIKKIKSIKFEDYASTNDAEKDLSIGKIDGVLLITGNPGNLNVELKTSKASTQNGILLQTIIKGIVNELNLAVQTNKIAQFNNIEINGREYKQIDFFLPGQLGFALLNSGIFGSAFVLISLKETLVLKRFFATPIKKINILIGEGLARLVFSTVQALVIILAGRFFFGFTLIHGFTTLLEMLILCIFGLLVFLGMGLMISSISKDQNSIAPIANLFTLPQFLLGGVFFSIDLFPNWLQPLAKALPLTHLNDALRKIAYEGASFKDVSIQLLVLSIWAVVVYWVTARMFKWDK